MTTTPSLPSAARSVDGLPSDGFGSHFGARSADGADTGDVPLGAGVTVSALISYLSQIPRPDTTLVVLSEVSITDLGTEYVDLPWSWANFERWPAQ